MQEVYAGIVGETALHAELEAVHADHDVVLCPVNAARGLIAGDDYVDHAPTIGGVEVPEYFWACLTIPFNICSRNPVLVVPAGFAHERCAGWAADRRPALRRRDAVPHRRGA